jgi:hypothetical protein
MVVREAKKYFLPADQQSFSDRWSPKALPIDFLIGKSVWASTRQKEIKLHTKPRAPKA